MQLSGPGRDLFDGLNFRRRQRNHAKGSPHTLSLDGLHGRVEVVTDGWGVPHIQADTTDDLFFAQGFITARDRLFQLDYSRHGARGRLCELLGERKIPWRGLTAHLAEKSTLDVDIMLRTFGMEKAAKESLPLLSDPGRAILHAYVAGVNAYLATRPKTLEHRLLKWQPAAWTELDTMVMFKVIGFELNFAWRASLFGGMLAAHGLPDDVAAALSPAFPQGGSSIGNSNLTGQRAELRELAELRGAAEIAIGIGNGPGVGSNSFVVAGSHSASGESLLANDTHLGMVCPLPWHEVHLHGGGLDLHGFALAGTPGIGIGQTPHHAWAITAGLVHDLDLFREQLHPNDSKQYKTPDGWQEFVEREEIFHVRGGGHQRRIIRVSRHGPVLETLSTEAPEGTVNAIEWTGHQPGADLDALIELWTATSREQFAKALRHHVCPTYNVSYAGADGSIGYFLAGRVPKRRKDAPLRPLEGWTGEWDWGGVVPYEDNPRVLDPECGFLVTANNRVGPWDYEHALGGIFEPPYRHDRLTGLLKGLGRNITLDHMQQLQVDAYSPWGAQVRDLLLDIAGGVNALAPDSHGALRAAAEILRDWDGEACASSAGAGIAYATAHFTGAEVITSLADEHTARAFAELASVATTCILELAAVAPQLSELGVDLRVHVCRAFRKAFDTCVEHMGSDPSAWRWGKMHTLTVRHRFDDTPMGALFSIGPEAIDGGPDTVNRGDFNPANSFAVTVGPALRFVTSGDAIASARTMLPAGQSGDRLSRHYDDQLGPFLSGALRSAASAGEVAEAERHEILLPSRR